MFLDTRIVLGIPYNRLPLLSWSDQDSLLHMRPVQAIPRFITHSSTSRLLGVYHERRRFFGMAAVRPCCLLTKVNHRWCLCSHSIVLLPKVLDFLPRKSLKKGLSTVSTCCSIFHVFTLKMQIKTASLEGAHTTFEEFLELSFLSTLFCSSDWLHPLFAFILLLRNYNTWNGDL